MFKFNSRCHEPRGPMSPHQFAFATEVSRRSEQFLRRLTAIAAAAVVVACEKSPTPPPPTQPAQLHLTALVSASSVTSIVVTVGAADISPSLVYNFPVANGVATGTLTVPTGSDRQFRISAFDAA